MCKHYEISIKGKVQGVWCRKYIQDKAKELGITGFTQNMPDGSVYVEAEAQDEKNLLQFIKWLYQCSPLSKVEEVIILNVSPCKEYVSFEIKK